ncbi:cortex morphogenetic protein CmpA [Thalassorhabdus alkalitolerans]|uniref:Cortex morphogenetic protein CmpA n=1 Tax=Thalassorhabdus alkalitolerans TaxID=2282697 RepID=A0ABW0YRM3_9BACI|nr:cortex morphogenetic protein CmpA [Thalassobacillus sp. C254]
MPDWFKRQIERAYYQKNIYEIKLLNQCWFKYKKKQTQE